MMNTEEKIDQRIQTFKVPVGRSREEAWEMLSQKLDFQPKKKVTPILAYWVAGAVAAMILVFLGLFQSGLFAPVTSTLTAMQQRVWLPDSSMVLLNSRSTLTANYQFIGGKRQLKLEGEAYFRVKKGKPFQVSFPGGKLQVLGTEFNVIAYSPEDIRVDCATGKVRVEINHQFITLEKGQGVHLKGQELEGPYAIGSAEIEKRQQGIYTWNKQPLDEIFTYLGNRFGYTVSLAPTLQKRNFSGTFTLNSLQQSLEVLSEAMQVNYSIDESLKRINIEAR